MPRLAAVLSCIILLLSITAQAAELPLKRVVITTSGLALYEHQGTVTGNQTIDLPVRLDRVDDILKSLVVTDGQGKLGGISLPGREPLSQAFRDLPFSQQDLSSPVSLLNALQGADVVVNTGKGVIAGKLMSVTAETEQTEHGTITRHRVSILTPDGIRTALLESLDRLQFTDKTVQAQLDRALGAMFSNRIKDQRSLAISLVGEGERPVGLAYIQEAPLWKSSYRLVLPGPDGGKARLQGWAVLENTTGQDWKDVSVTLMSGSPVTYQQALYQSYYVPRPELPVKVMNRILPRVDTGTFAEDKKAEGTDGAMPQKMGAVLNNMAPARQKAMMMEERAAAAPAMASADYAGDVAVAAEVPPPEAYGGAGMATVTAAAAEETASQLVFTFAQPVTLTAGNTLMLPFISQELAAEKLYVYQPETNGEHPLAAVSLANETGSGLPPGILTLFDGTAGGLLHVGDAEMPMVPKGETRFISFALDSKTKIDRQEQEDRRLGVITIAGGMLNQKILTLNTTTYTIKAPDDEDRTVVLELPRREGWELQKPEGTDSEPEKTQTHYRVRVAVPAGQAKTVKLTLRRDDVEVIALNAISPGDLDARLAAAGKDIPADLRKALEKIRSLRAVVYDAQVRMEQLQTEQQQIVMDQERLRQNLQTVSPGNDLGKRYLKQLNAQEDRLDQLNAEMKETQQKINEAQSALVAYLRTVTP